jgi:ubiquinone/menaquinone biosynthesis C-methylase UbiE
MSHTELKKEVSNYWNKSSCGTEYAESDKYTKSYYEEIERHRYAVEPEIIEFANFPSGKGKKLLEIGVGAGSDFSNWIKNGADANGIDLTEEAIGHVKKRLELFHLEAESLQVDDAENLSFDENTFDIIYSWGVIHHSPNTEKALDEIIRVLKPGGEAKIMIYNRKSLLAYFFWFKHAFLKFKWNMTVADVLWEHMESEGTKGYTVTEIQEMLSKRGLEQIQVETIVTYYDRLKRFSKIFQIIASFALLFLNPKKHGWFLTFTFRKK